MTNRRTPPTPRERVRCTSQVRRVTPSQCRRALARGRHEASRTRAIPRALGADRQGRIEHRRSPQPSAKPVRAPPPGSPSRRSPCRSQGRRYTRKRPSRWGYSRPRVRAHRASLSSPASGAEVLGRWFDFDRKSPEKSAFLDGRGPLRRVQADSLGHPVTKLFVILAAFLSVSMLVLDTGLQRRGVATMVGFADDLDVESTTVS